MAITYEWSFPNFETNSENVVKTIHWRYTATDSETDADGNAYVSSLYGSCSGAENQNFDTMTKQECIDCVLGHQDITQEDMETNLANQIEEQKTPALTSKTKEW